MEIGICFMKLNQDSFLTHIQVLDCDVISYFSLPLSFFPFLVEFNPSFGNDEERCRVKVIRLHTFREKWGVGKEEGVS